MKTKIARLKSRLIHGVTPAMATPIGNDGYSVNTAVIPALVDFLIERGVGAGVGVGVKGLFAGGSTGEGIALDLAERQKLHTAVIDAVDGRVPVLVHVGALRTDHAITLARHAEEIGADAIAAMTPYFYGMDDGSLALYFQQISAAAPNTPLILYDIPQLAVNGISPALLGKLADTLPNLAGMKSSRADAGQIRSLLDARPDVVVALAGNETIALGLLALGMDGLLSGLSTAVPEPFVALTEAFAAGDLAEAQRQQAIIRQILALTPNGQRLGWIKAILAERGVPVGPPMLPRTTPVGPFWPAIERLLAR
ncbi:MAG: dihydrodipicolinate synthase family protein [Chloroflexi bacterium]|nr:dihydrodipicolinate synthase family protein [Chloroflexota bacterium]